MTWTLFKKAETRPRPCRGRFIAMDWGGRYVQFALAEHTLRGTRFRRLLNIEMPADLSVDDAQAMGTWLAEQMHRHRLRATAVLMNVPRSKVILKPLRLPETAEEGELAGMVQYQVLRDNPYHREEAVIDFVVGAHYQSADLSDEPDPGNVDVLAAVIHRREVAYYQAVAAAAGLSLHRLTLRSFSDMHSVRQLTGVPVGEHVAIVHLSADCAEIGVMADGSLEFCQSSDLTIPRAEQLPAADQLETALDEVAAAVVNVVVQNLQIYRMSYARREIDRLLVTGATALEQRVSTGVSEQLKIPQQILAPDRSWGIGRDAEHASVCLSAIGSALIDGDDTGTSLDFIHPRQPAVPRSKLRRYGPWAAAAAAVVIVPLVILVVLAFSGKQAQLRHLQTDLASLKKAAARADALVRQVKALDDWQGQHIQWLDHWAYLCSLFPSAEKIYVHGLKTSGDRQLGFTALAKSPQTLSELAERLQQAGYDYQPQRTESRANNLHYPFMIVARIMPTDRVAIDLAHLAAAPRPADDVSLKKFNQPRTRSTKTSGLPATGSGALPNGAPQKSDPAMAGKPSRRDVERRRFEAKRSTEHAQSSKRRWKSSL